MSTSNHNELKENLDQLAESLLVLVYGKYEVMPSNAKPEVIWTMLAEMTDGIYGVCRRLARISDHVSPNMILEGISKDANDEVAQADGIIKGVQRSSRASRSTSFDNECRYLSPPRRNTDPKHAARVFHEMIFVDSDCFLNLSHLQPGSHGWILVFRDELKDWLLATVEPFHVLYEDRHGKRTYFGIYTARMLPRANMYGAEFACLNDTVRDIIITALSRSERGSTAYNATKENLLFSLKTLPCIFLQCMEFLPVMYRNFMTDVGRLVQPVPRVAPLRPPGLPSPVKRWKNLSTLPSQVHADVSRESSHVAQDSRIRHQQTQSSQQVSRPVDNDKTPRAPVASMPIPNHQSSVIFSTATPSTMVRRGGDALSSCDDRRGNPLRKASAGHQTHQSDISANPDRIGPVGRLQPLQRNVRNNYQPCNRQPDLSLVSHCKSMVPKPTPQNSTPFSQASSYSGAPRGYQVQNQNINPIRNTLIGTDRLQIAGQSTGSSYYPPPVPSQNFPLPQHETAGRRFYNSQSYRAQRMR